MTLHVEGEDVRDVLHKLGSGSYHNSWISIDPVSKDFGRGPTKHFRVRYDGMEESFVKIAKSERELLRLIVPLWKKRLAAVRKAELEEIKQKKAEAAKVVKAALASLKAAKKLARSV